MTAAEVGVTGGILSLQGTVPSVMKMQTLDAVRMVRTWVPYLLPYTYFIFATFYVSYFIGYII